MFLTPSQEIPSLALDLHVTLTDEFVLLALGLLLRTKKHLQYPPVLRHSQNISDLWTIFPATHLHLQRCVQYVPFKTSIYLGGFQKWGTPKWMVYKGNLMNMYDLGVPLFQETPILDFTNHTVFSMTPEGASPICPAPRLGILLENRLVVLTTCHHC